MDIVRSPVSRNSNSAADLADHVLLWCRDVRSNQLEGVVAKIADRNTTVQNILKMQAGVEFEATQYAPSSSTELVMQVTRL